MQRQEAAQKHLVPEEGEQKNQGKGSQCHLLEALIQQDWAEEDLPECMCAKIISMS